MFVYLLICWTNSLLTLTHPKLKYMYQRPLYFAICIFGISFILLGNVATNSMAFGMSVLDAAGKSESDFENYDEVVRGIAIACIAFSCLIHGVWRQGGLYLNNLLAFIKIAILVLIFIIGLLAYGGVFGKVEGALSTKGAFNKDRRAGDAYGYAEAFLSVIYAFSGFNQANYVIGEVDDPRRRYKWPAFSAVAIVSVLYILVNLAYFIVVPTIKFDEALTRNVAHEFFDLTLGSLSSSWAPNAPRLLSAFMAIASLGNILVFTYTAARVKQEIAKEGIIPFRRFFASSIKSARIPIRKLWGSKLETLPEDIPFGALILHFSMSVLLVLGTWQLTAFATYSLLVDLYSYTIEATFSTIIGFGLVYQRLFSSRDWNEHSRNSGFKVNTFISCTTGLIFGLANLYPVVTKWVPPQLETAQDYPWYTTGVVGWSILAFGAIWWAFFRFVVPHIGHDHKGRYLLVTRKLWFHTENEYKVLEYEDIDFNWVPNDDEEDGLGRGDGHHARLKIRERSVFATGSELAKRRREDGIFGE